MIGRASRSALAVLLIGAIAAGCETIDPYTGEKKTSDATYGALIGAGAGAAIGMISGHDAKERRQRALIGAGVGGLSGGGAGAYIGKHDGEPRAPMHES